MVLPSRFVAITKSTTTGTSAIATTCTSTRVSVKGKQVQQEDDNTNTNNNYDNNNNAMTERLQGLTLSVTEWTNRFDMERIVKNIQISKDNLLSGGRNDGDDNDNDNDNDEAAPLGSRGEFYVAAQAILMLAVLLGGLPFLGTLIDVTLGPVMLLVGLASMVISVIDLGESLSPFPKPAAKAALKTEGIYSQVRHPMYAGVLAASVGLSVMTDSADRLIFTALLWYLFDLKSNKEELFLQQAYPDYVNYMVRTYVCTSFLPSPIYYP